MTITYVDEKRLVARKHTPQQLYLDAKNAYALKKEQANQLLFVDVRTCAELEFVGVPALIDFNIPYMINRIRLWDSQQQRFPKEVNKNFIPALERRLDEYGKAKQVTPLLLICRSGNRSAWAAHLLFEHGYKQVYNVVDGFEGDALKTGENKGKRQLNGWINAGLPWDYRLEERLLYEEYLQSR